MTSPPPPPAMEAMEATMEAMETAAATERFRRLFVCYLRKKKKIREYVGLSVCPNVCLFVFCLLDAEIYFGIYLARLR